MKQIKDYEGFYEMDEVGEVFSIKRQQFVKPYSKGRGYYEISLSKNGMAKRFPYHRLIALTLIPNPENKPFVDHINRNPSDNRIENLRWCTYTENQLNKGKKNTNATSKYKGVSWDKLHKRWVAYATKDKKNINIGGFQNEVDAAKRYNEYVTENYGGFASLNEI